jgi:hypothetical protein
MKHPKFNLLQEHKPVYDTREPNVRGVLVKKGEEVSEVRWGDGSKEFVTNEYLRPTNA